MERWGRGVELDHCDLQKREAQIVGVEGLCERARSKKTTLKGMIIF